jgi:IS605 OrfB family transposase
MSIITIQCRLVAPEETLRHLWELMALKNTPLVNELLSAIAQHPDLEIWLQQGKLPAGFIKTLCNSLKTDSRFAGQPGRFYSSAVSLVDYIYRGWFALRQRRLHQIQGKERWLSMLKSDLELERECNCYLDAIRTKATEILANFPVQSGKSNKAKRTIGNALFDAYKLTEDSLTKSALIYLLKNNCQIVETEEDAEEFSQRRRKKEIEIERLKDQLKGKIPKGRDLTGEMWQQTLQNAAQKAPKDTEEAKSWQAVLLGKPKSVPFPVAYGGGDDFSWFKDEFGRIFVRFNGSSNHTFEVYCDRRQFHWFERFVEDQETKRNSQDRHSSGLFTLRSGQLVWHEHQGKGKPWNVHRLILHCSVDTSFWTAEGTKQIAQTKTDVCDRILATMKEKEQITDNQKAFIKRTQTTRDRLQNPFPRPSKPVYQGQSHLLVGVSLGLEKPATVAVVDAVKGKVINYRSIKQLLGDRYKLLNRQRQQQQRLAHERHKAQKYDKFNEFGESELGEYVDRLIAASIVEIAKAYAVGSIVLPQLGEMAQIVQSEVLARAKRKFPGYKEGQQQYAKEYRVNIHNWSYSRLQQNIKNQAAKAGIPIEIAQQSRFGTPQEKARDLALFAYQNRTVNKI